MASSSSSGRPKLEKAPVDLVALREQSHLSLLAALDAIVAEEGGAIRLVLDQSLSGPLGLIAEVREFREHGVDKIYHLEAGPPPPGTGPLVYFVRASLESARAVAVQLASAAGTAAADDGGVTPPPPRATLHFVPRRSLPCEKLLEEVTSSLEQPPRSPLRLFDILQEDTMRRPRLR